MKRDAESAGLANAERLRLESMNCDCVVTGGPIVGSIMVVLPLTAKVDDVQWGLARHICQGTRTWLAPSSFHLRINGNHVPYTATLAECSSLHFELVMNS